MENKIFEEPKKQKRYRVCVIKELNIREKPDINSAILGTLENNAEFQEIHSTKDWVKFKYKNSYGWVRKEFLLEV